MAVKTWVWVVVVLAGIAMLGFIALIGAGMYFVAREVQTRPASRSSAEQTFETERSRFGDAQPLLEIDEDGRAIKSHLDRDKPSSATRPESMYVLAWDPEDERLARVRLPFWLLRLGRRGSGGSLRFGSSGRIQFERLNISVDDLERLGPALIIDYQTPHGERVLVWTQ